MGEGAGAAMIGMTGTHEWKDVSSGWPEYFWEKRAREKRMCKTSLLSVAPTCRGYGGGGSRYGGGGGGYGGYGGGYGRY